MLQSMGLQRWTWLNDGTPPPDSWVPLVLYPYLYRNKDPTLEVLRENTMAPLWSAKVLLVQTWTKLLVLKSYKATSYHGERSLTLMAVMWGSLEENNGKNQGREDTSSPEVYPVMKTQSRRKGGRKQKKKNPTETVWSIGNPTDTTKRIYTRKVYRHCLALGLYNVWDLSCLRKELGWLKAFPHSLHLYGFSPVCILMCPLKVVW